MITRDCQLPQFFIVSGTWRIFFVDVEDLVAFSKIPKRYCYFPSFCNIIQTLVQFLRYLGQLEFARGQKWHISESHLKFY